LLISFFLFLTSFSFSYPLLPSLSCLCHSVSRCVRRVQNWQGKGSLWNPVAGANTILHSTPRQNFTTASLQGSGTDYTYVDQC